jgi:hypothetical protein
MALAAWSRHELTHQDLIAEDMVPLRQISLQEIESKLRDETVSYETLPHG